MSTQDLLQSFRVMFGVPVTKTRRSVKDTRRYAWTRLIKPKTNLVSCQNCGQYHEIRTICGHCYSKVRDVTNKIKAQMMQYDPYEGTIQDREHLVRFKDEPKPESEQELENFRVIEIDDERPKWFSDQLTAKWRFGNKK